MKEYKIDKSNKLIIKQGRIEEEKGDALLCWSAINLKSGPESFFRIHRKAGAQVLGSIILLEPHLREGSAFTSIPGLTEFFVMIHAVLPIHPALYNDAFFNIVRTIKQYQESDVCRDLYLNFPFPDKKFLLNHLLTYTNLLNDFTFYVIVDDEKEYKEMIHICDKKFKLWRGLIIRYFMKRFFHVKE